MRRSLMPGALAVLALAASGCGEDTATTAPDPPPGPQFLSTSSAGGFSEDFSTPTLDPAWTVVPGARYYYTIFGLPVNDYSLSANPGYLRYTLNPMSHPFGFLNGYVAAPPPQLNAIYGYDPGLEIYRSISGDFWVLEAKGTFYLPCVNGRSFNLDVYFGPGGTGTTGAGWVRSRDTPLGCTVGGNSLSASVVSQPGTTAGDLLYDGASESFSLGDPASSTFYLRLERAAGLLTWSWSTDGTTWAVMFSKDFGTALDGLDQRVTIVGHSWFVPAGSYADWDYINVTPTTMPDLTVDKGHTGNFTVGSNGTYTIRVANDGTAPTDGSTITVTDVLDPLLDFVSVTGTDWTCDESGGTVTCTRTTAIAEGDYSDILLSVVPTGSGTLTNTASVAGGGESDATNNTDGDPTTIDAAPTTSLVSVVTPSPQYSDQVALGATVTPPQIGTSELSGTVYFYVGAAAVTCTASPPAGSVGSDAIAAADDGVAEIMYDASQASGAYTVTACFYSTNADFVHSDDTETLTVGKENATVTPGAGNGNAFPVGTAGGTASFTLTFVVREATSEPDPNGGALPGDVDNAGLTVQLQAVGSAANQTIVCSPGAPIVTPPAYSDVTTFTCSFTGVAVDAYEVVAQVTGDYYVGSYGDALGVYDPSLGFVTAGGKFTYPGSSDRVSFGLSFTYTGKGKTTPRGNIVVIRHYADGSRCRTKSNGVGAPAISGNTASFSGKANYACLDALGNTLPGGQGNLSLLGYVEDNAEPGAGADKFWIRVYDELMMSKPAAANAALLTGGNVEVPKP